MQDINQQLYERKDTPQEFIPVYSAVVTVSDDIYTYGEKEFTCDKTFDEVREILLKGGGIIAIDNYNRIINFYEIIVDRGYIRCDVTFYYNNNIEKIILSWDKNAGTKTIITNIFISKLSFIKSYNIGTIITKILNSATNGEVLTAIKSIFISFDKFTSAINKPNSIFYDDNGKYSVRISGSVVVIVWDADTYIGHVTIDNTGAYTYNTIQVIDQTLYRLSALTVEPIVNPKIWIGTATQYAAIAEKDVNTTYIVKSDA